MDGEQQFSKAGSGQSDEEAARALRISSELRMILAGRDFARAPIMKRLLEFLVDETISGRGDQLKAYSVAVDGLGRAPDYDARADSYPRVQVGRLRRMLAQHYKSNPTADGQGIVIPNGRYRVTIGPRDGEGATADPAAPDPPEAQPPGHRFPATVATIALLVVAVFGAAILAFFSVGKLRAPVPDRPMLELNTRPVASDEQGLRNLVQGSLLDGLQRSATFDVRVARPSEPGRQAQLPAQYRLTATLVPGTRPRLFLRLWRLGSEHILWTSAIDLPPMPADGSLVGDRLAPLIAAIGRVDGVIASQELANHDFTGPSAYQCLLLYHQMRREHLDGQRAAAERCIKQHLATNPDNAGLQAAAAQLALSRLALPELSGREREGLLVTAQRHAEMATGIDPLNPWANVAQASVAVSRRACPRAINDAMRASQLEPFDPALLADAGTTLLNCGDIRAEALIRRAIALDDRPEGRFYGPLLLVALDRGDHGMAQEALMHMTPPVVGRRPRFYLMSAAGYAMIGDAANAKLAWTSLSAIEPAVAHKPLPYLERSAITARARSNAIEGLRRMKFVDQRAASSNR